MLYIRTDGTQQGSSFPILSKYSLATLTCPSLQRESNKISNKLFAASEANAHWFRLLAYSNVRIAACGIPAREYLLIRIANVSAETNAPGSSSPPILIRSRSRHQAESNSLALPSALIMELKSVAED
uniref:Uncharacterized protein n=1 Tax=Rhizophora mucronata TaxID=61149 RepID=A0A2P2INA9_RHIMU